MLLRPIHHINGWGAVDGWLELIHDYHALLRHALKACPAPAADNFAEWSKGERERIAAEVSELKAQLDAAKNDLNGLH